MTQKVRNPNIDPRIVWGLAILGLILGGVQVFGNLAQAAAEADWARFDRLLSWLWITIAAIIGLSALVLLAMNLVMLPFWRLRTNLRRQYPDRPVHLSYEATQPTGESSDALSDAIGPFSVLLIASPAGLQLWRGREPQVVLELPADIIQDVEFECERWRRPVMRVTLADPTATILFFLADEVALGVGGSSPSKVKQIVVDIAAALD